MMKVYRLNRRQRQAIVSYLEGRISLNTLAFVLSMKRQNVHGVIASIVQHVISAKKLDARNLIKHY